MKLLKYSPLILLCVLVLSMTSCQDDEDVYALIVGHTWVGDLGFSDRFDDPLESGLTFWRDGSGVDEQCYYDDGTYAFKLKFYWQLGSGVLDLDYGREYPPLQLREVYVTANELRGVLYVDGYREGTVILHRQ